MKTYEYLINTTGGEVKANNINYAAAMAIAEYLEAWPEQTIDDITFIKIEQK